MFKAFFVTLIILSQQLLAQDSSDLKLGIGLSFISIPEYIGSSVQKQYILPYPYIYYDSENMSIENNVLFNHLYHSEDFNIDLSFSGTLPVKSDSTSLRHNMEQLDPTLEVGLNFIYKLFHFKDLGYISIELPIRTVHSLSFSSIEHQGYITNPNLYSKYYINKNTKVELSTGLTFATQDYHNYFYEVKAQDVTANRREYHSKSGYGGWKTTIGISHEHDSMWYGAFARYYNLNDTEFINSPLIDKRNALFYGLAASYIF